jgi:hypothetical protein
MAALSGSLLVVRRTRSVLFVHFSSADIARQLAILRNPRHERAAARVALHAGRLLPAGRRGRHDDRCRVPVLRRLGAGSHHPGRRPGHHAAVRAHRRAARTGGYNFGTLFVFDQALTNRYGTWSTLDSYVAEAQLQNYENTRSQFEAFLHHSTKADAPSTGTIYWQATKGWPSLLWNLYNLDSDTARPTCAAPPRWSACPVGTPRRSPSRSARPRRHRPGWGRRGGSGVVGCGT